MVSRTSISPPIRFGFRVRVKGQPSCRWSLGHRYHRSWPLCVEANFHFRRLGRLEHLLGDLESELGFGLGLGLGLAVSGLGLGLAVSGVGLGLGFAGTEP